ncbi:hypothetical protein FHU36_001737 [Nonomuraea muscovyensis]|uniref:Uncharacterized protein n=1 Tax=Nonomuraea muscovyensis TaxID=1124761 RepID=A0A7X0EV75_9ACTN|nr:hypothetical protein [Nonomuraea muscovyensis]MBB6345228.1 hypothetical protein [Nonomuraea muscovyensis]
MGTLGAPTTYMYWSELRVREFLEANNIRISKTSTTIKSPNVPLLPVIEHVRHSGDPTMAELADKIEASLGESAVSSFDTYPVRYAKGIGSIIFSEFVSLSGQSQDRSIITTETCDSQGHAIAICLFGSMHSFDLSIREAGPGLSSGASWRSSVTPEIIRFIDGDLAKLAGPTSRSDARLRYARYAFEAAHQQGMNSEPDFLVPWKREFTYGDIQNSAEWLADVIYDIDFVKEEGQPWGRFVRLIIGAPVWIRTPKPQDIRLYSQQALELEQERIERLRVADHPGYSIAAEGWERFKARFRR